MYDPGARGAPHALDPSSAPGARWPRTGRAGKSGAAHTFFHGDGHEKALAGALQNVLRAAGADVPAELLKFGSTVKKKEDKNYGAFGPRADLAGKKATKIVFD